METLRQKIIDFLPHNPSQALVCLFHTFHQDDDILFVQALNDALERFPNKTDREKRINTIAAQLSNHQPLDDEMLSNLLLFTAALAQYLAARARLGQLQTVTYEGLEYLFSIQPTNNILSKHVDSKQFWFAPLWLIKAKRTGKEICSKIHFWQPSENTICALIEFNDRLRIETQKQEDTFVVTQLPQQEERWQQLLQALEQARAQQAELVLLPELSLPPDLLRRLKIWLDEETHDFKLVAAGSWHIPQEHDSNVFNRMEILGPSGNTLARHDKWYAYQDERLGIERITRGAILNLFHTPLGLISFVICKDFCHAGGFDWQQLPLSGMFVASMGNNKTVSAHLKQARNIRLAGSRVLLANLNIAADGTDAGFYLPAESSAEKKNAGLVSRVEWFQEPEIPQKPKLNIVK